MKPVLAAMPPDPVAWINAVLEGTPYGNPRFLGRGGMGTVHAVEHRLLGRDFALKMLHPRSALDAQTVDRMRIEAQALARLEHPNIVEIVDFWIDESGRPCVVMERLLGRTLAEELRERKRLPTAEAVSIACQVLSGLAAAHELGLVHRDLKPENLFLHELPDHKRVLKVLDFGIARVLPDRSDRAPVPLAMPTTSDTIVGSPRFISPEAREGKRVDGRADVYSAGLVLYAMLAGRGPFDAGETRPSPPSRTAAENVPPLLDAVILHAIEPRPEDRYPSAAAFLKELRLAEALRTEKTPR